MGAIYAHFDDLDLDARSQWVGKGNTSQRFMLSATKQAISIKLATTVGLCFFHATLTLTLQTFVWFVHLLVFNVLFVCDERMIAGSFNIGLGWFRFRVVSCLGLQNGVTFSASQHV